MFCPSVLQLFYGCSKVLMTNHGMSFFVFVFCFSKPAGDPSSATLVSILFLSLSDPYSTFRPLLRLECSHAAAIRLFATSVQCKRHLIFCVHLWMLHLQTTMEMVPFMNMCMSHAVDHIVTWRVASHRLTKTELTNHAFMTVFWNRWRPWLLGNAFVPFYISFLKRGIERRNLWHVVCAKLNLRSLGPSWKIKGLQKCRQLITLKWNHRILGATWTVSRLLSMPLLPAECGDYDPVEHLPGYVSEFKFVPDQVREKERGRERERERGGGGGGWAGWAILHCDASSHQRAFSECNSTTGKGIFRFSFVNFILWMLCRNFWIVSLEIDCVMINRRRKKFHRLLFSSSPHLFFSLCIGLSSVEQLGCVLLSICILESFIRLWCHILCEDHAPTHTPNSFFFTDGRAGEWYRHAPPIILVQVCLIFETGTYFLSYFSVIIWCLFTILW